MSEQEWNGVTDCLTASWILREVLFESVVPLHHKFMVQRCSQSFCFLYDMIICPTAQLSPRLTGRKPQDFPLEVHLILWIIDGHELIPREKMLGYWWHDKKPVHHPALQFLSKDTPSPPFPSRVVLVSVYFAATPSQRQALILRSTVPKQPCHLPHAAAPLPKIHRWSAQVNFSF